MDDRFRTAIAALDAANAEDPNRLTVRGETRPKALGEAELATVWLEQLRPTASEALRLAVRGHHVRRWTVPRTSYPDGRAGYLKWRTGLYKFHAEQVGAILRAAGYDDATVERVGEIVRKRRLASDPEVQAFEDALCLVFLETQFADLAGRLEDEKMVDVVAKTLVKMSPEAQQLALELAGDLDLVQRAVATLG